jgi:hypothetical protein
MICSHSGNDLCAHALIETKANLEAQTNYGHTALMLSSQNGHEGCCDRSTFFTPTVFEKWRGPC